MSMRRGKIDMRSIEREAWKKIGPYDWLVCAAIIVGLFIAVFVLGYLDATIGWGW